MTLELAFYANTSSDALPLDAVGYPPENVVPEHPYDAPEGCRVNETRFVSIELGNRIPNGLRITHREGVETPDMSSIHWPSHRPVVFTYVTHVEAGICGECNEAVVIFDVESPNVLTGVEHMMVRYYSYNASREEWGYESLWNMEYFSTNRYGVVFHARCALVCISCRQAIPVGSQDLVNRRCEECQPRCLDCNETFNDPYGDYGGRCSACYMERQDERRRVHDRRVSLIHNYSYKPEPNFLGDGKLFFGLELEMLGDAYEIAGRVHDLDPGEEHWYCKQDASVEGTEIVTHPMSPDWIRESGAITELMSALNKEGSTARVKEGDRSTGVHIHVSRAGFSSDYHMWKWAYFQYANNLYLRWLAGRSTDWGTFTSSQRPSSIIGGGAGGDLLVGNSGSPLKDYVKKKSGGDHGAAINPGPEHTLELRYFSSTLSEVTLRGYFEVVEAIHEYTQLPGVKARGGRSGKGSLSGLAFRKWLSTERYGYMKYPNLMKLSKERGIPMTKAVTKAMMPYNSGRRETVASIVSGRSQ